MKTLRNMSVLALGAMMTITSCKKDSEPAPSSSSQPEKSFKVRMTDNPGNYQKLDVEIESIAVLNSNNEWIELNGNIQTVSVLELTNGKEKELAFKTNLEADVYTKLKIEFTQNNQLTVNSTVSGGTSSSILNVGLNIGSGTTVNETLILDIDEEVSASASASVLIDFNVAKSVIENSGSYIIDPVVTLIEDAQTGVKGMVENDYRAALMFELNSNSSVSYSAYTNEDGEFMVRGMADGTYTLTIMPDQDEDPSLSASYTISNVTVVDGQITDMGEVQLNS